MRKLLIVMLALSLFVSLPLFADDTVEVEETEDVAIVKVAKSVGNILMELLEKAQPGVFIDFIGDDEVLGGINASIATYKDLVSLDIGAIGDADGQRPTLGASVNVEKLAERLGLDFQLPGACSVGTFVGYRFEDEVAKANDEEWLGGVCFTWLINW